MGSPQADIADSPVPESNTARRAILAAARRVAERDGILDLSLLSVALEAGVPPGSVYGCFNSKNDLLICVIADDLGTLAHAMRGDFDSRNDDRGPDASVSQVPSRAAFSAESSIATSIAAGRVAEASADADESDAQTSASPALNAGGAIEAITKLQETVARLETRPVDAWLERRLREFERSLSALEGRQSDRGDTEKSVEERFRELNEGLETLEHRILDAAGDSARSLVQRIDACENRLRGVASDTHADATTLATRVTALENAAFALKPEFFVATPGPTQESDNPVKRAVVSPAPEVAGADQIVATGEPAASYIAAARKSAQAAAIVQDSNVRVSTKQHKSQTMLYVAMGSLFLFVAVLTATGLLLRNFAMNSTAHTLSYSRSASAPVVTPLHSGSILNPQQRLHTLAAAGDTNAQLIVGLQYLEGSGASKNDAAAFSWLSRAAAHNEPIAQFEVGMMYQNGRGAHADPAQAFRWFESAALKGNRRAMHSLANAYAEGWGADKNISEAARWYGRAAQLGSVNDQFNLGVLFERGMGITGSLPDAYKWYAIAAAQGDKESQSRIAAIEPMLAPEDLAAAQNAAQTFKPDALSRSANFPPTLTQKR